MIVPGLTLKYLFTTVKPGIYFTVIDSQNQDLQQIIEENITGGPSLFFVDIKKGIAKILELKYGSQNYANLLGEEF